MKYFCALSPEGVRVKHQWRPAFQDWQRIRQSSTAHSWYKDDYDRKDELEEAGYTIHDCNKCRHKFKCLIDSTALEMYDPAQKQCSSILT